MQVDCDDMGMIMLWEWRLIAVAVAGKRMHHHEHINLLKNVDQLNDLLMKLFSLSLPAATAAIDSSSARSLSPSSHIFTFNRQCPR